MATTINANNTDGVVITPDTSGELELQANGVTKAKVTANGLQDANGASLRGGSFRNLIINGDMSIAQRGTSATSLTTSGYKTIDRMQFFINGAGTWTMSQDTDVPTGQGFVNSMKWQCTTANASLTSGQYLIYRHNIEGQNCQHLKYGTSSAEKLTLSFWVKSNKTGTYTVTNEVNAGPPYNGITYTINSANTWEKKTLTYTGNTSTSIVNNNTTGVELQFWLAESGFSSANYADDTWHSVSSDRVSPSQVNLADSTSNYINITGVQLEVGEGASDFEFLPYDVQLARCQRYYEKSFNIETAPADNVYTQAYLANVPYTDQWVLCAPYIPFKVEKRATPSVVYYGSSGKWQVNNTSNSWVTFSTVYSTGQGSSGINTKGMSVTVHNGGNSGYSVSSARTIRGDWTASAEL